MVSCTACWILSKTAQRVYFWCAILTLAEAPIGALLYFFLVYRHSSALGEYASSEC